MHLSIPNSSIECKINGLIDISFHNELNSPNPDSLITALSQLESSLILLCHSFKVCLLILIGDKV